MDKKNNKFNIFMGIISMLTLLFMGIGASFAYFSSAVRSEQSISVGSVDIRMGLDIRSLYSANNLLPTDDDKIIQAFKNKCLDSIGNEACSAYTIEVTNIGDAQEIIGSFKIDNEEFKNLKYMVLDENNIQVKDATNVGIVGSDLFNTITLDKGSSKKLTLVIWLSNLTDKQDYEQGLEYRGTVTVSSSAGAKITGTISKF